LATPSVSGEIVPLAKANSDPARPAIVPATTKAIHCSRGTRMPIAAARTGESRLARRARPNGACSMRTSRPQPATVQARTSR
jgi:hypothetical protein